MEAKEQLKALRIAELKVKQKQQELERLKSDFYRAGQVNDRVQTAPKDLTSDRAVRIIDLADDIVTETVELVNLRDSTIKAIHTLSNPVYVDVLYRRYVLYQSFEDIAADLNYSARHVQRIHGYALAELNKKAAL